MDARILAKLLFPSRTCQSRLTFTTFLCVFLSVCAVISAYDFETYGTRRTSGYRCVDDQGRAQRCIPEFVNAAFNVRVEVTNTCGVRGPTEYCVQTGVTGAKKSCEICDASIPHLAHPPEYLTDFNNNDNQTWWQSETMYEGIRYPKQVNLTFHLGKSFDITYVRLKFHSSRPESFAIYKRTTEDGPWIPYQYYSATCLATYNLPDRALLTKQNETSPICTSEYSDISPLSGGNVAFSTLEGRISAYDFENSPILQEWVTATDIRITLDRMNTFGDEIFGDPKVLKSYYYAISDFAVGGRCKCNGHASECVPSIGDKGQRRLVCRCEHNTAGPDCNECKPFYNDQPWGRATNTDVHECKACNCNGRSNKCRFDEALWKQTGHGGYCIECTDNTDGPHCERCKENFYQIEDGRCLACHCDPVGSRSLQCNNKGQCACKPGVEGQRCDRCAANYYEFSPTGCRPCGCVLSGSADNTPSCDPVTGSCRCKDNVEGQQCEKCKPGFFNLQTENEFGCLPCFCFGHSSICKSSPDYYLMHLESTFARDREHWTAQDSQGKEYAFSYNAIVQNIAVRAPNDDAMYFVAPAQYLGDQRASYNQFLMFTLSIQEEGPRATVEDIILEGSGMKISQPIFGQGNPMPTIQNQAYKFRLHEDVKYGWNPRLSAHDFIGVLSNLTAIKIRATYTPGGNGVLDDVRLESAHRFPIGQRVSGIETCDCPTGYIGQFCESCTPGFRHDPPNGGPFSQCVPCNCHGHAEICETMTGRCICQHNTAGDNCERCATGYYGNAVAGTPNDCVPCPCPNQGACVVLLDGEVACLQCPEGFAGHKCDLCVDGYYGDPIGLHGPNITCQKCDCSGNIDPNAVGNCDTLTGECLKCIYNTGGHRCERCLSGYFGDPLALPKGDCKACGCHPAGTYPEGDGSGVLACSQVTGQCSCKPYVVGQQCDRCANGYWNLASGEGCTRCNCDRIGSFNETCDERTGQCYCRPGVTGKHCEKCMPYHYGFSLEGCKECDCDRVGSIGLECSPDGQCECRPNVEGRRCDRCKENKHNKEAGCIDCPPCYNLVQDAANNLRSKLQQLEDDLEGLLQYPKTNVSEDFKDQLNGMMIKVNELLRDAENAQVADGSLFDRLNTIRKIIKEVQETTGKVMAKLADASESDEQGQRNISLAQNVIAAIKAELDELSGLIKEANATLNEAIDRANKIGRHSEQMSEIAREARQLSEEHKQQADAIHSLGKEALNTSTEANELAKEAIGALGKHNAALQEPRRRVDYISGKIEDTLRMSEKVHDEANRTNNAALDVLIDLRTSPKLPAIDVPQLKSEAKEIIDEARRTQDSLDEELQKHQDLLNETTGLMLEAMDLLREAERQQQIADELFTDTDAACAKANSSVLAGEQLVKDAQKTLDTLNGFDALVNKSKLEAEDALKDVDSIKRLIEEAEDKTYEADAALSGTLKEADEARDIAVQAQTVAEQASQDADQVKNDADKTKAFAEKLAGQADSLTDDIARTSDRMEEYENQANEDEAQVKEALESAGQASAVAGDASKKVKDALQLVQDILNALENMDSVVDSKQLDELERKLDQAEQELKDADLDNRMNNLKGIQEQQTQWMRNYDEEIKQLQKDVRNIAEISGALPDDCFKNIRLEP